VVGIGDEHFLHNKKLGEILSPSFCLHGHVGGHFHLPVALASVIDGYFEAFGSFIGNPVCAALTTDKRRYIPHDNHAKAEVNGKGGCALRFCPTANVTNVFCAHGFLRVR